MVRSIATKDEFDALLASNTGKAVVVDFTATWCGPCQRIAPVYEKMANEFPQAVFVKVDVDQNRDVAAQCGIRAMPTFKLFKNKSEIAMVQGGDESALRAMVKQHAGEVEKFTGHGRTLGGGGAAPMQASSGPSGAGASSGDGQGSAQSEREKRLAALERRGLLGGGGGPAAPPLPIAAPVAIAPVPTPAVVPTLTAVPTSAAPPPPPSTAGGEEEDDAEAAMLAAAIALSCAEAGAATTSSSEPAMDVADAHPPLPPPSQQPPQDSPDELRYEPELKVLTTMGFERAQAMMVLVACNGNLERAVEMLAG